MATYDVNLGRATNLLSGFRPDWNPSDPASIPLFDAKRLPLKIEKVSVELSETPWAFPRISLHDDADSLLSELFPYRVGKCADDPASPDIPPGPLLIRDKDSAAAIKKLSESLGVDLSNPDFGFSLVVLERKSGEASHYLFKDGIYVNPNPLNPDPGAGVTEDFRKALIRLRHGKTTGDGLDEPSFGEINANAYLESFRDWGTHFLSRVHVGDRIFQMFAHPRDRFAKIKTAYAIPGNVLSGPGAEAFAQFTTDVSRGHFGYVAGYGKLLVASGDKKVEASITEGKWLDKVWARQTSIFAPFQSGAEITFSDLDEHFRENAPYAFELHSLDLCAEFERRRRWRRVLKAALYQKYMDGIQPNFVSEDGRDFETLLPEDSIGFVSTIATPHINTYKKRIDLSEIPMIAGDGVKDVTFFTNVLSHAGAGKAELPGIDVVLVSQILDFRSRDGRPKRLQLIGAAFQKYVLRCRECLGALLIVNDSDDGRHTLVDGFRYVLTDGPHDRYDVRVDLDLFAPPPADLLPRLSPAFEFAFTFAQAVASDRRVNDASGLQVLIHEFLGWMTKDVIPEATATEAGGALLDQRIRCLDLAKLVDDPNAGSFVPILPFRDYEKEAEKLLAFIAAIDADILEFRRQIDYRKQQELIINVHKDLNQAIVESGELLVGIIESSAARQLQMAEFYDEIIGRQKQEQELQQAKADALEQAVNEQRVNVADAVEHYKQAVENWQKLEWIRFGLEVAAGLLQLGLSFAVPANAIGAVASLGLIGQRVQKMLNVLTATNKLYNEATKTKQSMEDAQNALDKLDDALPGDLAWDEMDDNLKEVLALGPDVKEAKARLSKEFTILSRRGKAWLSTFGETQRLSREIYFNQRQRDMNRDQAKRLAALQKDLDPPKGQPIDRDKIDLIGLTGSLSFMRNEALLMLSTAFMLQDRARQYEFLQPATAIGSFSLLTFSGAVARQESATVTAKAELARLQPATTTPIEFAIDGVEVDSLIRGNTFTFAIRLDNQEFLKYVHARVLAVVVEVDGIVSTDSGDYLVNLAFDGDPYFDRDTTREPMAFRTPQRQRTYEYQLPDNTPKFTDRGFSWSEGVSPVTPFSSWQISIPDTMTNKGMVFKDTTVRLSLSFVLKARIKDIHTLQLRAQAVPTKEELIRAMYAQGSVVNGWDVVYNMALEQINATMAAQYEENKRAHPYGGKIEVDTFSHVAGNVYSLVRFRLNYGYPEISFLQNNDRQVKLEMLISSGSVQKCVVIGQTGEPQCDPPAQVENVTFTAYVPIGQIEGLVKPDKVGAQTFSVVLDFSQGSFDVAQIDLSPEQKLEFSKQVKLYFTSNPVTYIINTLDLSEISTLDAMRPNAFLFRTLTTPANVNILQLYITTANRPALDSGRAHLNNCDEPLPYGYQSSMMIGSRLFYGAVLTSSLNLAGWRIEGFAKGGNSENVRDSWYGKYTSGAVRGRLDLNPLHENYPLNRQMRRENWVWLNIHNWPLQVPPIPRLPPSGGPAAFIYDLDWSIVGMTIVPGQDGRMRLTFFHQAKQDFLSSGGTYKPHPTWTEIIQYQEKAFTTEYNINIDSIVPLTITKSGREQDIHIDVKNVSVEVSGHMSGGGPSNCDNIQAIFNRNVNEQLPPQVKAKLNVGFAPISIFALKNLLFPTKNYIDMQDIAAPGDVLLLGNFKTDS
ncbi:hypothetical protein IC762_14985 [Bradyrhizobium genosp. L]|uniref:hypothetical protein n=1 Tax=Bradyrhizobium genosp. L TaxID=83637 RepID=UPI0018A2900B|nr:hypothetical protein [Bradyrhizobium genosp. L]QPF87508.1 hypothetical protein IC762_14985 [Bradyrhizobium genosp. L]